MSTTTITLTKDHLSLYSPQGELLPESDTDYQAIVHLMQSETLLKDGKYANKKQFEHRVDHLHKVLTHITAQSDVAFEWQDQEKSVVINVSATLPPKDFHLILIGGTGLDPDWPQKYFSGPDLNQLQRDLETIFHNCIPFTESGIEKLKHELRVFTRKNPNWVAENLECNVDENGVAHFELSIAPKAKNFAMTVDGAALTVAPENDLPEIISPERRDVLGNIYFKAVSDSFAASNRILVVQRGDKLQPYLPEYRKHNDTWQLIAPNANGGELPITTIAAPTFLDFQMPQDLVGNSIGPDHDTAMAWFYDTAGHMNSATINNGLMRLTRWYQDAGYPLVSGHLESSLGDETLHVSTRVYHLSSAVVLTDGTEDAFFTKRPDILTNIQREFRFSVGDVFNTFALQDAIASIDKRFIYTAIPTIDSDNVTGLVTIHVQIVRKDQGGTPSLTVGGGAGSQGVFFQGSSAGITPAGYGAHAGVTAYPFESLMGADASITTPRDASGGWNDVGVGGQYYADFISSVSATYHYNKPLGHTRFSLITGGSVAELMSEGSIDGTNALYFEPDVGIAYDARNFHAQITGGPRFNTLGDIFAGVQFSAVKRWDLDLHKKWYIEVYTRAGIMYNAPDAALWHQAPVAIQGVYVQTPAMIPAYAVVGIAVMRELPGGFLDVGLGANAGFMGAIFAVGGGVRIKLKMFFPMTITIGPALVNGVPTPVTVSFG